MSTRGRTRGKPRTTESRRKATGRFSRSPPTGSRPGDERMSQSGNGTNVLPSPHSIALRSGHLSGPPRGLQSLGKRIPTSEPCDNTKTARVSFGTKNRKQTDRSPQLVTFGTQVSRPFTERGCVCDKDPRADTRSTRSLGSNEPEDVCCKNDGDLHKSPTQMFDVRSGCFSFECELQTNHVSRKGKPTSKDNDVDDTRNIHSHSGSLLGMRQCSVFNNFPFQDPECLAHKQKRKEDQCTPRQSGNDLSRNRRSHRSPTVNDQHQERTAHFSAPGPNQSQFQYRFGGRYYLKNCDSASSSSSTDSCKTSKEQSCDRGTSPITPTSTPNFVSDSASSFEFENSGHGTNNDRMYQACDVRYNGRRHQMLREQYHNSSHSHQTTPEMFPQLDKIRDSNILSTDTSNKPTSPVDSHQFYAQTDIHGGVPASINRHSAAEFISLKQNSALGQDHSTVETSLPRETPHMRNGYTNNLNMMQQYKDIHTARYCSQKNKSSSRPVQWMDAGQTSKMRYFQQGNSYIPSDSLYHNGDQGGPNAKQSFYMNRNLKPLCDGLIKPFPPASISSSSPWQTEGGISRANNVRFAESSEPKCWERHSLDHLEKQQQYQRERKEQAQLQNVPEQNCSCINLHYCDLKLQLQNQTVQHQTKHTGSQRQTLAGQSEEYWIRRKSQTQRHHMELREQDMLTQHALQRQQQERPEKFHHVLQRNIQNDFQENDAEGYYRGLGQSFPRNEIRVLQQSEVYSRESTQRRHLDIQQEYIRPKQRALTEELHLSLQNPHEIAVDNTELQDTCPDTDTVQDEKRKQNGHYTGLEKHVQCHTESDDMQQPTQECFVPTDMQNGTAHRHLSRSDPDAWHQTQPVQLSNRLPQQGTLQSYIFGQEYVEKQNIGPIKDLACPPHFALDYDNHMPANIQRKTVAFSPWRQTVDGREYPVHSAWQGPCRDHDKLMTKSTNGTSPVSFSPGPHLHQHQNLSGIRTISQPSGNMLHELSGRRARHEQGSGNVSKNINGYHSLGQGTCMPKQPTEIIDVDEESPIIPAQHQNSFENHKRSSISRAVDTCGSSNIRYLDQHVAKPRMPPWIRDFNTEILRTWERVSTQSGSGQLAHAATYAAGLSQFPCIVNYSTKPEHSIIPASRMLSAPVSSQEPTQFENQLIIGHFSRESAARSICSTQNQQNPNAVGAISRSVSFQSCTSTPSMHKTYSPSVKQNTPSSKNTALCVSEPTIHPTEHCGKQVSAPSQVFNCPSNSVSLISSAGQLGGNSSMSADSTRYMIPGNFPGASCHYASSFIPEQRNQTPCNQVQGISRELRFPNHLPVESVRSRSQQSPYADKYQTSVSQVSQKVATGNVRAENHSPKTAVDSGTVQTQMTHNVTGTDIRNGSKRNHCPAQSLKNGLETVTENCTVSNVPNIDMHHSKHEVDMEDIVSVLSNDRQHQVFVLDPPDVAEQSRQRTSSSSSMPEGNNWHTPEQTSSDVGSVVSGELYGENVSTLQNTSSAAKPQTSINGCSFENTGSELRISGVFSLAITKRRNPSSVSEGIPPQLDARDYSHDHTKGEFGHDAANWTQSQRSFQQDNVNDNSDIKNICPNSHVNVSDGEDNTRDRKNKAFVFSPNYDCSTNKVLSELPVSESEKPKPHEEASKDFKVSTLLASGIGKDSGVNNVTKSNVSPINPIIKCEQTVAENTDTLLELCDHKLQCVELEGQHYVVLEEFLASCFPGLGRADVENTRVHKLNLLSRTVQLMGSDQTDYGRESTHVLALPDAVKLLQYFHGLETETKSSNSHRQSDSSQEYDQTRCHVSIFPTSQNGEVLISESASLDVKLDAPQNDKCNDVEMEKVGNALANTKTIDCAHSSATDKSLAHRPGQPHMTVENTQGVESDCGNNANIVLDHLTQIPNVSHQTKKHPLDAEDNSSNSQTNSCSEDLSPVSDSFLPEQSAPRLPPFSSFMASPSAKNDVRKKSSINKRVLRVSSHDACSTSSNSFDCLIPSHEEGPDGDVDDDTDDAWVVISDSTSVPKCETTDSNLKRKMHSSVCSSTGSQEYQARRHLSSSDSLVIRSKISEAEDYRCEYLVFDIDDDEQDDVFMENSIRCEFYFGESHAEEHLKETQSANQVNSHKINRNSSVQLLSDEPPHQSIEVEGNSVESKRIKIPSSVAERQMFQRKQIILINTDQVSNVGVDETRSPAQIEQPVHVASLDKSDTDILADDISVSFRKRHEDEKCHSISKDYHAERACNNSIDKPADKLTLSADGLDSTQNIHFTNVVKVKEEKCTEISSHLESNCAVTKNCRLGVKEGDAYHEGPGNQCLCVSEQTETHADNDTVNTGRFKPSDTFSSTNQNCLEGQTKSDSVQNHQALFEAEVCVQKEGKESSNFSSIETHVSQKKMLSSICTPGSSGTTAQPSCQTHFEEHYFAPTHAGSTNKSSRKEQADTANTESAIEPTSTDFDALNENRTCVSIAKHESDSGRRTSCDSPKCPEETSSRNCDSANTGLILTHAHFLPDEAISASVSDLNETYEAEDGRLVYDYRIITLGNEELISDPEDSPMYGDEGHVDIQPS